MAKNIEDIIVPERKRTIRNIPIPESRKKNNGYGTPEVKRDEFDFHRKGVKFLTPLHSVMGRLEWRGRKGILMATGVALLILIFATLSLFNGATLSYVPQSVTLSFDNDVYTAQKVGEGKLLYSVVKLSGDKGLEVSASGEEKVSRKASGKIIVYNNASKEPQKLRATTRFETPDGKIYQVQDAAVIPGKKVVGGVDEPGALEVTVYAERPGKEFNIGLTDFTLPGLKGTSSFSSVYARSKTEMTGGFAGTEKIVKDQDRAQAKTQLEAVLRDELISEAKAQVPEGFILLPALSSVTFEDLPQSASAGENSATVNMRGNLSGVMFKKGDLSTRLAFEKTMLASGDLVDIIELESLNFSFSGVTPAGPSPSDEIKFSVTGKVTAVWRIDETALKTDLIGKHKKDISSILNNYPTITSAVTTIRPFWKNSFPDDSARILVKKLPAK